MAPKGQSTRPTADKVRQALFNVLEHAAWSPPLAGARIIDLFAGSGALGLEALSRGAAFCLFADDDSAAVAAIRTNLEALGLQNDGEARRWNATRLARDTARGEEAFDIAFLDPPYARGLVAPALSALRQDGWLAPGAVVVVERGAEEPGLAAAGYTTLDSRAWGAARMWFLCLEAPFRSDGGGASPGVDEAAR